MTDWKDSIVTFRASHGLEVQAHLVRTTRLAAVFEISSPEVVVRVSEAIEGFKIAVRGRTVYSGRAVIHNLMQTGAATLCEATLTEGSWMDVALDLQNSSNGRVGTQFREFLDEWQKHYLLRPEFKSVMADFQTFLWDLSLWLGQVELGLPPAGQPQRMQYERDIVHKLATPVIGAIDTFIEKFEAIAGNLEPELVPIHRSYLRRQLHPLVLCSPFAYRAFSKPLGYAGDYEMVDMMLRPPDEGGGLYAKIINTWLLGQTPAQAHRNRVEYLSQQLMNEAARVVTQGRPARCFSLGCGPAAEVQHFLTEQEISNRTIITLLDFNQETLQHAQSRLDQLRRRHGRRTVLEFQRKSVHHLLKESASTKARRTDQPQFDFVYCAGLFDYLSDPVCKRLTKMLYDQLAPGGLLLATNVSDAMNLHRPFRYSMEYILDWHLTYRNGVELAALIPEGTAQENARILSEDIGVNVIVEIRKPLHG